VEGCSKGTSWAVVAFWRLIDETRRLHNFALFIRPKVGQLVLTRYINSLIRFCKTRGRGSDTGILWLPVT